MGKSFQGISGEKNLLAVEGHFCELAGTAYREMFWQVTPSHYDPEYGVVMMVRIYD